MANGVNPDWHFHGPRGDRVTKLIERGHRGPTERRKKRSKGRKGKVVILNLADLFKEKRK